MTARLPIRWTDTQGWPLCSSSVVYLGDAAMQMAGVLLGDALGKAEPEKVVALVANSIGRCVRDRVLRTWVRPRGTRETKPGRIEDWMTGTDRERLVRCAVSRQRYEGSRTWDDWDVFIEASDLAMYLRLLAAPAAPVVAPASIETAPVGGRPSVEKQILAVFLARLDRGETCMGQAQEVRAIHAALSEQRPTPHSDTVKKWVRPFHRAVVFNEAGKPSLPPNNMAELRAKA